MVLPVTALLLSVTSAVTASPYFITTRPITTTSSWHDYLLLRDEPLVVGPLLRDVVTAIATCYYYYYPLLRIAKLSKPTPDLQILLVMKFVGDIWMKLFTLILKP